MDSSSVGVGIDVQIASENLIRAGFEWATANTPTWVTLLDPHSGPSLPLRCKKESHALKARELYRYAVLCGMESNSTVGNCIIHIFLSCDNLLDASRVLRILPEPNVLSWHAIILANAKEGRHERALEAYDHLRRVAVILDSRIHGQLFVALLKACAVRDDLQRGQLVHCKVLASGLHSNVFVANTLVDMYGRCGFMEDALLVFQALPEKDVVTWNALIAGYARSQDPLESLRVFQAMQDGEIWPDRVTFVCILKSCSDLGHLNLGKVLHAYIVECAFDMHKSMGSTLIDMYGNCGSLNDACNVFEKSPKQDATLWGTMITKYVEHRHKEKALGLFHRMQDEGIELDRVTALCGLRVSSYLCLIELSTKIHARIIERDLEAAAGIGAALIEMYCRCGYLQYAEIVFYRMPSKDVLLWSVLMNGYIDHGYCSEALHCFEQMQLHGIAPDKVIFVCIMKACLNVRSLNFIHTGIVNFGCELDTIVANTLIDMYNKHGNLEAAIVVFRKLPVQDAVTWNVMIDGLTKQGWGHEALSCLHGMHSLGLEPNLITYVCLAKACSDLSALKQGTLIHACFIESGLVMDHFLNAALIDMYSKCGCFEDAFTLLNNSPSNVVAWNALISGLTLHDRCLEALELFNQMQQQEHISADQVTFTSILTACSNLSDAERGRIMHCNVLKSGLEMELFVGNSLIDMYGECGNVDDAVRMFERMEIRNGVSWGTFMVQLAQHGQSKDALCLFDRMWKMGIEPDQLAYIGALYTCTSMAALEQGLHLHSLAIKYGIDLDVFVGTTLITMYGKCGMLQSGLTVFNKMPMQSIVSWNAIIGMYADDSNHTRACQHVENMRTAGFKPNNVTYLSLLSVCNRLGLVSEGCTHFVAMRESDLLPAANHYNRLSGILGYAGYLKEAEDLLETVPVSQNFMGWSTLVSSCRVHGEVRLAKRCFQHATHIDTSDAAVYVAMSSIYFEAGMRDEALKIEDLRRCQNLWKKPGRAYIEVNNQVHEFIVGEKAHKNMDDIDAKLHKLRIRSIQEDYGFHVNPPTLHDDKKSIFCGHCVKTCGY